MSFSTTKYAIHFPSDSGPGYILNRPLTHGSQGEVFLVTSLINGQPYVLKTLIPDTPTTESAILPLFPPGTAVQLISHTTYPHRGDTIIYSLCNGGDLHTFKKRVRARLGGELPEVWIWDVVRQITEKKKWQTITHGDVSDRNIFVHWPSNSSDPKLSNQPFPQIIIGDFGYAQLETEDDSLWKIERSKDMDLAELLGCLEDLSPSSPAVVLFRELWKEAQMLSRIGGVVEGEFFEHARWIARKLVPVAEKMIEVLQEREEVSLRGMRGGGEGRDLVVFCGEERERERQLRVWTRARNQRRELLQPWSWIEVESLPVEWFGTVRCPKRGREEEPVLPESKRVRSDDYYTVHALVSACAPSSSTAEFENFTLTPRLTNITTVSDTQQILYLLSQHELLEIIAASLCTPDLYNLALSCRKAHERILKSKTVFNQLKRLCLCDGHGLKARQDFSDIYALPEYIYSKPASQSIKQESARLGPPLPLLHWDHLIRSALFDEEIEVRVWNLNCDTVNALPCVRCGVNICEECRWIPRARKLPDNQSQCEPHISSAGVISNIVCYCNACYESAELELPPRLSRLSELCDCNQYKRWVCLPCFHKESRALTKYTWDDEQTSSRMREEGLWINDIGGAMTFWCPCGERVPPTCRIRCGWCMRRLRLIGKMKNYEICQGYTIKPTRAQLLTLRLTRYLLGMGVTDSNIAIRDLDTTGLLHPNYCTLTWSV